MRETLTYKNAIRAGTYLILFFSGILAGVAFVQTQKSSSFAGIFSEYFLNQYASLQIDFKKLFRYVGSCRLGQYALLVCSGTLASAPFLCGGLVFVLGMTWGTVISISTLRLGMKGMLICAAGIVPQIFFYIPAFGWILLWVLKKGCNRKKYLFLATAGLFFLFFGIVAEVYLNPRFLQQILRKMS